MNSIKYIVDSNDLKTVFQKFQIHCDKSINEEEFVKSIHEITQIISIQSTNGQKVSKLSNK